MRLQVAILGTADAGHQEVVGPDGDAHLRRLRVVLDPDMPAGVADQHDGAVLLQQAHDPWLSCTPPSTSLTVFSGYSPRKAMGSKQRWHAGRGPHRSGKPQLLQLLCRRGVVVQPPQAIVAVHFGSTARGDSPMNAAVNCQLCPVLSVVALRIRIGTFASRRQLWYLGWKGPLPPASHPCGSIVNSFRTRTLSSWTRE